MPKMLICYNFEKIDSSKRKQFDRELFGTVEKTHHGKYVSIIKGILTNKKYERPIRAVIIFENDALKNKISNVLTKYDAKFKIYDVIEN